jgi:hypothetical protein
MKLIDSRSLSIGMFSLGISRATIATAQTAAPVISLLFSFPCNSSSVCPDGFFPTSLIKSADGNLYGRHRTKRPRHNLQDHAGRAAVSSLQLCREPERQPSQWRLPYRFSSAGAYTILHTFTQNQAASSGLIQASNGKLFGLQNGSNLFNISLGGNYQKVGPVSATQFSDGHLVRASDGNLWGDFTGGDCSSQGVVFAATTSGSVLQNLVFDCSTVGEQLGTVIQGADGKLYGVTPGSGVATTNSITHGTVWKIEAGLPAPAPTVVGFRPASARVGAKVLIQGNHFVGATSVTFNGVNAGFQVLSVNYISATVPAGATTGPIAVTNAGGTVSSQKTFTVQ